MKTRMLLKGVAIASALATFAVPAVSLAGDAAKGASVKCEGGNDCKGKGSCSGAKNDCKGKNACKGQGFTMSKSKAACEKVGGHLAQMEMPKK